RARARGVRLRTARHDGGGGEPGGAPRRALRGVARGADGLRLRRLPRLPGRAPRGRLSLHLRRRPLRGGRRGGLGPTGVRMIDLSVSIGRVRLKNPVLTASGTFGYGLEYDEFFDVAEL